MAPSAILPGDEGKGVEKVKGVSEKSLEGVDDKTPLEAISHGDVAIDGMCGFLQLVYDFISTVRGADTHW